MKLVFNFVATVYKKGLAIQTEQIEIYNTPLNEWSN